MNNSSAIATRILVIMQNWVVVTCSFDLKAGPMGGDANEVRSDTETRSPQCSSAMASYNLPKQRIHLAC